MKQKATNKGLSLLLALVMVLTLIPAMSVPTLGSTQVTADYTLFLDDSTGNLYKNDANSDDITTEMATAGATISGNQGAWVLTLNGFNFETSAATALVMPAGSTIHVESGTASIVSTSTAPSDSIGISASGNLEITGSGTLNVKGGNPSGTGAYASKGIYVNGASLTVDMNGGALNVEGGSSTDTGATYGIHSSSTGSFTMSGGTVEAKGGTGGYSYGIYVYGLTVNGGEITGEGGTASGTVNSGTSYGIYIASGKEFSLSNGTVTAKGGTCNGTNASANSYGINFAGNLSMTGGTISAKGGTTPNGNSIGVFSGSYSTITISGGTITAEGGTTSGKSYGINAANSFSVTNTGILIAKGTDNAATIPNNKPVPTDVDIWGINAGGSAYDVPANFDSGDPQLIKATADGANVTHAVIVAAGVTPPAGGGSSDPDYTLYYNSGDSKMYKEQAYTTEVTDADVPGWTGNGATLTLDGFNFETTAAIALVMPAGTTINLADGSTNTITSTYNSTSISEGIKGEGTLTIMGDTMGNGILNVTGGTSTIGSGIYSEGALTVSGGIVTATGGSSGIYFSDAINISGGTVTATGNTKALTKAPRATA